MTLAFRTAFEGGLRNFNNKGTILEFGVATGNTYIWMAKEIVRRDIKVDLIGYDSFKGLPREDEKVWHPIRHSEGAFAFDQTVVEQRMKEERLNGDSRFQLVGGFFEESLKSERALQIRDQITNLMFVNVDVDLYISTVQLLDYIKPILKSGTCIYFDDWKDPTDQNDEPWGEHRAWPEWNAKHNFNVKWLVVGSANERSLQIL